MSETHRFFLWLYRVLAISALAVLLLMAITMATLLLPIMGWGRNDAVSVVAPDAEPGAPAEKLSFYGLDTLQGTGMQIVNVGINGEDVGRGSLSSYGGRQQRNLVFLAPGGGAATWLFPGNQQRIESMVKLCVCARDDDRVQALYLQVQPLDPSDQRVQPALVATDGTGYRALTSGPVRVLGHEFDGAAGLLGLLIEADGQLIYRQYTLEGFVQVSERTLARMPQG